METITVHALFGKAVLKDIAIDRLHSGTYQPRDTFSEEGLASLATTIEQLGILEPLIVRLYAKHEVNTKLSPESDVIGRRNLLG